MPFTSQKQRRLFYALKNKGEMKQSTIDRWNDETKAAQGRGDLPEKLPKYVGKQASIASMIGHRYNSEPEVSNETKERLRRLFAKQAAFSVAHKKKIYDVALKKHRPDLLDDERSVTLTNLEWMKPRESLADMKKMLPGSVAVSVHRQVFGGTQKTAAFPPALTKSLLGAINGAVAGALIGSRSSLDDQTVRGLVQGALTGALVGGAAAQATGSRAAQFAAGGMGGYLASRGPLGPSRPQVHVRLDQNNTGEAPSATEKMMDVAERIQSKLAMDKIAISDELAYRALDGRLGRNGGVMDDKKLRAIGLHAGRMARKTDASIAELDQIGRHLSGLRSTQNEINANVNKATAVASNLKNRPGLSNTAKGVIGVATLGAGLYAAHRINKNRKEAP